MEPNDPNAQGQQAVVNPTNDQMSGFQKRLDEVIGQSHAANRVISQMQQVIAEQQATIAGFQKGPAQQEQAPEVAPEDAQKIAFFVNKAMAPLQQQIQQLTGAIVQNRISPQMDQVQSELKRLNNPQITERTNELLQAWQRSGALAAGTYIPTDALKVAAGEFAIGTLANAQQNQNERQQWNQGYQPLSQPGGQGSNRAQPVNRTAAAPEVDLSEMSEDELKKIISDGQSKNPEGFNL